MKNENKILVGKIVAPQGLRGEVRVQTYTAHPTDFKNFAKIYNSPLAGESTALPSVGGQINLKFVRAIPNSDVIIAKIDGTHDRNSAETLRGTELFIDRADLPALPDGEYYQTDLIGMSVFVSPALRGSGEQGEPRGSSPQSRDNSADSPPQKGGHRVIAVHNFGAGDILELDNGEMVSFANATVDLENKIITL